jgi:hypothetical protein
MKASTLNELKKELQTLPPTQVIDLCIQLAKYKKENKELLSYLLFDSYNQEAYVKEVKELIAEQFATINRNSLFLAKKTIRKVLRTTVKYIKYSGSRQVEVELLICFCKTLKNSGVPLYSNTALGNLYERQLLKIRKSLETLHEDLRHDYLEELKG